MFENLGLIEFLFSSFKGIEYLEGLSQNLTWIDTIEQKLPERYKPFLMKLLDSKGYAKASTIAILQLSFLIFSELLFCAIFLLDSEEYVETVDENNEENINDDETNEDLDNYENYGEYEILEFDLEDEDDDDGLNGYEFYINVVFNPSNSHCFIILITIFTVAFLFELIDLFVQY